MRKFQPGDFVSRTRFDLPWEQDLSGILLVVEPPAHSIWGSDERFIFFEKNGRKTGYLADQFELAVIDALASPSFSLDELEEAHRTMAQMD